MKKFSTFLFAGASACLLLFAACNKKKGVNENLNPDNQQNYDFTTSKEGSYWKIGQRGEGTGIRRAMGKDTMVGEFRYSYYERQQDGSPHITPEYFGKNSDYYYTLVDLDGSETNYVPYAFYKAGAVTGDNWTNTANVPAPVIGNVNVKTESKVMATGLTMSWNGKTFENVIHVHTDLSGQLITWVNAGSLDVYFVKNIGVIREEANIHISSFYNRTYADSVIDYHLEY